MSLLMGFDLHFCTFERIVETSPGVPDDAKRIVCQSPVYVFSIQVTAETFVKPPGAFIHLGTVTASVGILVPVFGRESLTTVKASPVFDIAEAVT